MKPNRIIGRILVLGCFAAPFLTTFGKPEFQGCVAAEEAHARDGIGHVMEKIRAGKPVSIAYFGGSITAMDGWRRLSREWLQKEYPNVTFREINAAIGGTGSRLGVFRFGHDVLAHKPDLVFVEFATNDREASPEAIWENFDGFIRQAWRQDPEIEFVFAYTITKAMVDDYGAGCCPRAASAMEQLADFYGIPSVCFGPRVATEVKAGRLVMSMGEVETAVPKAAPKREKLINEELVKKGKTLFARDGVHPALPGHGFYLASVQALWRAMEGLPPVDHAKKLAVPFFDARLEKATMVPIAQSMLKGAWTKLPADDKMQKKFGRQCGQLWRTETPGGRIVFSFTGSECHVYDLLGSDCGQVWITVDGKRREKPVSRFDSYCTYYRLASFPVFRGEDGVHTVEIEVDKDQPDRTVLLKRHPGEDLSLPKYNGTKLFVGQLQVVGRVEKQ